MPRELNLSGIFFPSLLPVFLAAALAYWLLDGVLARTGIYRQVWHPALFRMCLFVCLFGLLELFLFS